MNTGKAAIVFIILGIILIRRVLKFFADAADAKVQARRTGTRPAIGGATTRAVATAAAPQQRARATLPDFDRDRAARAARQEARRQSFLQATKAAAERQRQERAAEVAAITGGAMPVREVEPVPAAVPPFSGAEPMTPPPNAMAMPVLKTPVLGVPTGPAPISPWLAALRDPVSARKAILMKEILGPPVGLR